MIRTSSTLSCIVCGLVVFAVTIAGQGTPWQPPDASGNGQTPVMPVHQEPHHRQVFQRGPMRILDLQVPPGDVSWFHTHEWPVYYLTTSDSPTVSQNLGEEWGAGRRGRGAPPAAGAAPAPGAAPAAGGPPPARGPVAGTRGRPRLMSDLSYAERPNTHRIRNDGPTLFRAMVVVNETAGGDETVTEQQAGFADKPISSNKWFRVYRIVLAPGEKTPQHDHKAPVVILQDTAGKGVGIGGMTFEFNEPGQWAYFDPGDRHQVSNTGDVRLELIEVEVRRK
jgi:mannose-6-phosphate isomerase-like protein (cupin superfamily)